VIGVGIDLVDIDRFRRVLERTPGMRQRLFLPAELHYADASGDPARPLAARFAAKEALLKSLKAGLGAMRFADIEVVRHDDGTPSWCFTAERWRLPDVKARLGLRSA